MYSEGGCCRGLTSLLFQQVVSLSPRIPARFNNNKLDLLETTIIQNNTGSRFTDFRSDNFHNPWSFTVAKFNLDDDLVNDPNHQGVEGDHKAIGG